MLHDPLFILEEQRVSVIQWLVILLAGPGNFLLFSGDYKISF